MNRRRFLTTTACLSVAGLAGCLGDDDEQESPESVVEAYFEAETHADRDHLLHPESAIGEDDGDDVVVEAELESYRVVERDIDLAYIESEDIQHERYDVESVAPAEELVHVEVVTNGETELPWDVVTATHEGDWYLYIASLQV